MMHVRCPECAALVPFKKVDGNYRGDCACGFKFRGEAPVMSQTREAVITPDRPLTAHEENLLTLVDAIFREEDA